jgi:hypothetical protein
MLFRILFSSAVAIASIVSASGSQSISCDCLQVLGDVTNVGGIPAQTAANNVSLLDCVPLQVKCNLLNILNTTLMICIYVHLDYCKYEANLLVLDV